MKVSNNSINWQITFRKIILTVIILIAIPISIEAANYRLWKDAKTNKTITAEILDKKIDNSEVKIRLMRGKTLWIKTARLVKEDQEFVKKWVKPVVLFKHSYKHLNEEGVDKYLFKKQGVKKYSEWQNPPLTYYGPSRNDREGKLIFKYSFDGYVTSAKLKIKLHAWNFSVGGARGQGSGEASAWASVDGKNWVKLIDIPTPKVLLQSETFHDSLPEALLGKKDIFLQIRLKVQGAPDSGYTTAQFSRSSESATSEIFSLEATYTKEK